MADVETQDQVHKDGTDHIKDKVFGEGEGTTPKPEPIVAAKPPASNPGADNPTAGIAKDAGGVSASAHVGSPSTGNKEKRKSIVGQLRGLFLGGDKKEREASEAGIAKQGATTTGAIAAGATGAGTDTGKAVDLPDRTKSTTATDSAPKSTTEQVKEAVTGDKEANTGAVAASTTEPTTTETKPETTETKPETTESKTEGPTDTSGDSSHKPPAPAGGKTPENRESIPTAGGERLGDKHWGESKVVPDNPKAATEASDKGVASSEGQPTEEVKDNTAKNTGGASAGPKTETAATGETKEKGKFMDKVKDKLPFGKKDKA